MIWAPFLESPGNFTDTKQFGDLSLRSGSVMNDEAQKACHSVFFMMYVWEWRCIPQLMVYVHFCPYFNFETYICSIDLTQKKENHM